MKMTLDHILKDISEVPPGRWEELYHLVHSMKPAARSNKNKSKILAFSGAFADFDENEYKDFVSQTETCRKVLFDRDIEI